MDTIGPEAITAAAKASPLQGEYGQTIDRESAYERLSAKVAPPEPTLPVGADGGSVPQAPVEPEKPSVVSEVLQSSVSRASCGPRPRLPAARSPAASSVPARVVAVVETAVRVVPPDGSRPWTQSQRDQAYSPPSFLYTAPTIGVTMDRGA